MSNGDVKEIDVMPGSNFGKFDFRFKDTESDFRSTRVYDVVAAINGENFCEELSFYRFIHNDLVTNPEDRGDRFWSGGGYIERSNSTRYKPREFCGYQFAYVHGSRESASAQFYSGGEFEYVTITR